MRTQTLLGKDAPYVPGWDCHGLPIEWKVEEQYRKKKLNKDEVPVKEFRAECRAYAQHWVDVQREQLKRLGISADWDKPYLTMDFDAEATIVAELFKFAESGQLYRGAKPVMWSPVEKTALAEAEIEYEDIVSTQIDVAFEIVESPIPELVGAHAVVWTTTPWTIPVNQAIAYGPDVEYVLADASTDRARTTARSRSSSLPSSSSSSSRSSGCSSSRATVDWPTVEVALRRQRLRPRRHHRPPPDAQARRLLRQAAPVPARRLRHHRPGHRPGPHGARPWRGRFRAVQGGTASTRCSRSTPAASTAHDWLWLGGQGSVINTKFNAPDGPICSDLREAGALLAASADFQHSYPHSWRSKAKVIYRCTPQWFIAMDQPLAHLTAESLAPSSAGRMRAARSTRRRSDSAPDAPPARDAGHRRHPLRARKGPQPPRLDGRGPARLGDQPPARLGRADRAVRRAQDAASCWSIREVNAAHRRRRSAREGVDAWDDEQCRGASSAPAATPTITRWSADILDVWFDSGCTHVFTLESGHWPDQRWPADLYLEGSDQHRGWFQSSLLESCGTRGRAPYDAVLTHGFTMDAKGMKMSKSLGNTVNPLDLMRDYGADILRLWALSVDFTEDHRIGKEILAGVADQYRKLRNTFRYLLGALDGFSEDERLDDVAAMPELERYMLHLTAELDAKLRQAVDDFDFNTYVRALTDFCNEDLSRLLLRYPQGQPLLRRARDGQTEAPRLPDRARHPVPRAGALARAGAGVHHRGSVGHALSRRADRCICSNGRRCRRSMPTMRKLGRSCASFAPQVTEAIEPLRRDKVLGSSLEAEVTVPERRATRTLLAELFIASTVHTGRCGRRDQDRQSQMRALLALSARSERGRRPVRPLRGGGEW